MDEFGTAPSPDWSAVSAVELRDQRRVVIECGKCGVSIQRRQAEGDERGTDVAQVRTPVLDDVAAVQLRR